jgi:hypothetical protein
MSILNHSFDGMVVLQNRMDVPKREPDSRTETCLMSFDDGNQIFGMKVEEVTGMKVEDEPEPATHAVIKTEPAVSYMSVCVVLCALHRYLE